MLEPRELTRPAERRIVGRGAFGLRRLLVPSMMLLVTAMAGVGRAKAAVAAPVLKWQRGGCFASWCQTGWYSSPAVADLDGNGTKEIVGSSYDVFVVEGATGVLVWRVASGHDRSTPAAPDVGRTWPGVIVADVDGDEQLEIVTAHGGGWVSVYDRNGYFEPGWPKQPTTSELRGLEVYDVDGDGTMEIVVTAAVGSRTNVWVYEPTGALRAGWPQLAGATGYAWGVYNSNAAVGDLDGDEAAEIVVPSDVHYIAAYEGDGMQIAASSAFGPGKKWSQVGVWESTTPELRGWGACDGTRIESYRTNFADGAALIADVDLDGTREIVVTGNVYDCSSGLSRYTGVYVLRADRTRFQSGPWDWTVPPTDTGAPLIEDYGVIESCMPDPALADIDGDGAKEILFSSYDGRVHAFGLDRTEHGAWPYSVHDAGEGSYRFASPPAVADLDDDGQAEVIFASWPQKTAGLTGKLHIVDSTGHLLWEVALPAAFGGTPSWNGALAAPTLADIDRDPDLEVVLNTAHSGLVAYDLPGTPDARVLWATGRGNNLRSGSCIAAVPPAVDDSLRIGRSGANDLVVSWQPQAGAAAYAVWRSSSAGMGAPVLVGRTTGTSIVDPGAPTSPAPRYFYQVGAVNVCGVEGP